MKTFMLLSAMPLIAASLSGPQQAFAETWAYAGVDTFSAPDGIYRSQGVATDGAQWFFSWQYGLERTDLAYRRLARNYTVFPPESGIPQDIAAQGGNHVGDIDYYAGRIYAPIEDSPDYRHPAIAVYDASSLRPVGQSYWLSNTDLVAGVPWVAVDGPKNLAYTAEWGTAFRLNVHRLADFGAITYIPLQQPLARIQGAKVRGDFLYAACDDEGKSIYRISLIDGTVTKLLQLGEWHDLNDGHPHEIEGLSFLDTPQGQTLNVLMAHGDGRDPNDAHTMFFHFRLVAP